MTDMKESNPLKISAGFTLNQKSKKQVSRLSALSNKTSAQDMHSSSKFKEASDMDGESNEDLSEFSGSKL